MCTAYDTSSPQAPCLLTRRNSLCARQQAPLFPPGVSLHNPITFCNSEPKLQPLTLLHLGTSDDDTAHYCCAPIAYCSERTTRCLFGCQLDVSRTLDLPSLDLSLACHVRWESPLLPCNEEHIPLCAAFVQGSRSGAGSGDGVHGGGGVLRLQQGGGLPQGTATPKENVACFRGWAGGST